MFDDYIGIQFKNRGDTFDSCDCFGLVRLYYKNVLKIDVFKPTSSAFDSKHIEDEYLAETSRSWHKVVGLISGDVIAMAHDSKHPNIVQHFGIYIGDGKMLHTLKNIGSHIAKIKDYEYYIKGYYRHG